MLMIKMTEMTNCQDKSPKRLFMAHGQDVKSSEQQLDI